MHRRQVKGGHREFLRIRTAAVIAPALPLGSHGVGGCALKVSDGVGPWNPLMHTRVGPSHPNVLTVHRPRKWWDRPGRILLQIPKDESPLKSLRQRC